MTAGAAICTPLPTASPKCRPDRASCPANGASLSRAHGGRVPALEPLSGKLRDCLAPRAGVSRPAQKTLGVDEHQERPSADRMEALHRHDAAA